MNDQDSHSPVPSTPPDQTPGLEQAYQDLVGREEYLAAKELAGNGVKPELSLLRYHIQEITRHAMKSSQLPAAMDLLTVLNRALQAMARLSRIQQILAASGEPASVTYQREMDRICAELQAKMQADPEAFPESIFQPQPSHPPKS